MQTIARGSHRTREHRPPRQLRVVRATDTVARLGGDEFAVLAVDLKDRACADITAYCVRRTVEDAPYPLPTLTLSVRASIGLTVTDSSRAQALTLLEDADRKMYAHKRDWRAAAGR